MQSAVVASGRLDVAAVTRRAAQPTGSCRASSANPVQHHREPPRPAPDSRIQLGSGLPLPSSPPSSTVSDGRPVRHPHRRPLSQLQPTAHSVTLRARLSPLLTRIYCHPHLPSRMLRTAISMSSHNPSANSHKRRAYGPYTPTSNIVHLFVTSSSTASSACTATLLFVTALVSHNKASQHLVFTRHATRVSCCVSAALVLG